MTTATIPAPAKTAAAAGAEARRRRSPLAWIREHLLAATTVAIFVFLLAPNAVMLLMSFNQPVNNYNYVWHRFSLHAWQNPCEVGALCTTIGLSVKIGLVATLLATVLGTMAAFAMVRHRFKARSALNVLLFLPMAAPEVIMGATLMTLFMNTIGAASMGFWTITIAHVMFSLSYVVVTVKARLAGMDPTLENAAQDLYATPAQTFRKVTLPLVFPGIAAAALLAFALSIDDYIITVLNSGNAVTFPMYVYDSAQHSVPTQIDVIGSMMLLITLGGIAAAQVPTIIKRRAWK